MTTLFFTVATLVLGGTALAQDARPDFSGTWRVEPRPAPPPPPPVPGHPAPLPRGDMGSGWGSPLVITQDAAHLTVEYAFFAPMDLQPPLSFRFALDGSETESTVWMGHGPDVRQSRARWEGDTLVLVTTHRFVDPTSGAATPVAVTRVLSLASPGALTVETTRAGVLGAEATSTRTTYVKP